MSLKTSPERAQRFSLTTREKQVLYMMANEHTGESIAKQLNIAATTVRSHRKKLYRKLNVKTSAGAVGKAFENGFLFFTKT